MRNSVTQTTLWLGLLALLGCPAPEPPILGPYVDLDDPAAFRVEATGPIVIGGRAVPGKLRSDFVAQPDGTIRFLTLAVWMEDVDLAITFAGWEVDNEPIRCARLHNARPIKASSQGDSFTIGPGEAEVVGFWFRTRDDAGNCAGDLRHFTITNAQQFAGVHAPQANHFAVGFNFTGTLDGQEISVAMQAFGSYLNRPPVGVIGSGRNWQPLHELVDGCPGSEKGFPPVVPSPTEFGLSWRFRSFSHDPDGEPFAGAGSGKFPRTDIAFEQWAHAMGDGNYVHAGSGPTLGPIVFAAGVEHRLLLTVTDRAGARDRVECHFRVEAVP